MPGAKVVPPKPEGLKKKEERDTKIATALKELRQKRRTANKTKRESALKKAQEYEAAYKKSTQDEITARRQVPLPLFRLNSPDKSTSQLNPSSLSSSESEVLTS
jgi:hypothetical protein